MNKSMYAKSEICQKCANCCKVFRVTGYNWDWAQRYILLKHPQIKVEKFVSKKGVGYWIVTLDIPCSALKFDKKTEKYFCDIYDSTERPPWCATYPDHIARKFWESERTFCPAIEKSYEKVKL